MTSRKREREGKDTGVTGIEMLKRAVWEIPDIQMVKMKVQKMKRINLDIIVGILVTIMISLRWKAAKESKG